MVYASIICLWKFQHQKTVIIKKKTINFRNSAGVTSDTGLLAIIYDQMILVALFI